MNCFHCNREVKITGRVARLDSCPQCYRDLKVCRNCNFYDQVAPQQCREPQAELVRDKEKANYCDFFTPNNRSNSANTQSKADDARSAFDNLFKKS